MADAGAHTAPLSQALLATMADTADQFLAAAYDVLMSNVRKVHSGKDFLQPSPSCVLMATDFTECWRRLPTHCVVIVNKSNEPGEIQAGGGATKAPNRYQRCRLSSAVAWTLHSS